MNSLYNACPGFGRDSKCKGEKLKRSKRCMACHSSNSNNGARIGQAIRTSEKYHRLSDKEKYEKHLNYKKRCNKRCCDCNTLISDDKITQRCVKCSGIKNAKKRWGKILKDSNKDAKRKSKK